jgi:F-type H+-transporting ATPase subunit epsilon
MASLFLDLVAPTKLVYFGEIDQVDLPGREGDLGVLAGHSPLMAGLRPGIVTVMAKGEKERFVIFGGVAEISPDRVTVLADFAEPVEDFDVAAFSNQIDEMELGLKEITLEAELDRAIARLDHFKSLQRSLVFPAIPF